MNLVSNFFIASYLDLVREAQGILSSVNVASDDAQHTEDVCILKNHSWKKRRMV